MLKMPGLADLNIDEFSVDVAYVRELARNLETLAAYATQKAQAMTYRTSGDITRARWHEAVCERLYENLPPNWKW